MALQDSTFKTAHVQDNEIIKASDFEFAFEQLVENVSKSTQMMLESNQDFVINGTVLPYQGMNVQISPIYGVCKSTGKPFGRTETAVMEYGFEQSTSGRVDIIEVQGDWETYDEQQRAFNDPDTDTQTYQYVDTKKLLRPVYRIKQGTEGSSVAPEKDAGWVKLAEVVIRANASEIDEDDIKNITSDVAGEDNDDWTTQAAVTYNIGYISEVNARFRVQHNSDGTHKNDVINTDSLNIGIGSKQVNGNVLPVGGAVTIPTQSISSSDSILSVITKAAGMITSLYNAYLLFGGAYKFNGELNVSAIADPDTKVLTNPIKIAAAGDGTATIKIGSGTVLSIDANGKLSTNGYTASSNNHIVTKAVTDAISLSLANLATRVTNLENAGNSSSYANGVLSLGAEGRYNFDNGQILLASTANVTLLGIQTIDGVTPAADDLVLIKDQTDKKENGIYKVSYDSVWQRADDYNTPDKIKQKIFTVSGGDTNAGRKFYVTDVDFSDEDFGYDEINILEYMGNQKPFPNRLVLRDANGRAQVAAPLAENDIARKAEITALYGNVPGTALDCCGAVGTASTFSRSDHVHPFPEKTCGRIITWDDYINEDFNCLNCDTIYHCPDTANYSCYTSTSKNVTQEFCVDEAFIYSCKSVIDGSTEVSQFSNVTNTAELSAKLLCICSTWGPPTSNSCCCSCHKYTIYNCLPPESNMYIHLHGIALAFSSSTGCSSSGCVNGYLAPGESCMFYGCVKNANCSSPGCVQIRVYACLVKLTAGANNCLDNKDCVPIPYERVPFVIAGNS